MRLCIVYGPFIGCEPLLCLLPSESGDILFFPVRPSDRPSVQLSVTNCVQYCEHNSSYNFIRIFLKLYRCFCEGLKMSMTFDCNPQINFCHCFQFELSHFWLSFYQSILGQKRNAAYKTYIAYGGSFTNLSQTICHSLSADS